MPLPQTNITAFDGIDVPTRADPANWDNRSEDAWARLKPAGDQMNVLAGQVNAMADAAQAAAVAATTKAAEIVTSAATASTKAGEAVASAAAAVTSASTATGAASAASDSAAAAAASALALVATSASAVTIGTGAKVFAVPAGKLFPVGVPVFAVSPADATKYVAGTVTSYVGTTLTINATRSGGAGSVSSWNIAIAGEQGIKGDKGDKGDTGGVNGGNLVAALNGAKAADVSSTAAPAAVDIWSGAGNYFVLTNNGAVTGLAAAPQAGASRRVLVTGAPTLAASSSLIIKGVATGEVIALAAGDELDIFAETSTKFRVTLLRGDGRAVAGDRGAFHSLRVFGTSGMFTATKTGWHKITLTGGSGGGAAASAEPSGYAVASGSGAGAFVSGMRYLVAGVSYVVTIGTGGAQVTATKNTAVNGTDGGATSFMGAGVTTMTAGGGRGGRAALSTGSQAGGAGGIASGGDVNVNGGDGGATSGNFTAGGGGAVGLRGSPQNGGAATTTVGGSAAGGGAGVGGKGGAATSTNAGGWAGASGGSGGPGADLVNASATNANTGANYLGAPAGAAFTTTLINDLDNASGGGGVYGVVNPTNGGGGSGSVGAAAQNGAEFAGGGGLVANVSADVNSSQGGPFGGAPGGVVLRTIDNVSATGRAGSSGRVWIEF